jgi:uncharacterized iron-regulated membrane protein
LKLSARTFQIQWDLHAWAGITTSLCLFVMFFAGVFALFHDELGAWQEPTLHGVPRANPTWDELAAGLQRDGLVQAGDTLTLRLNPDTGVMTAAVHPRGNSLHALYGVAPRDGERLRLERQLAGVLYRLHFLDPLPQARHVAGILALALLLVEISGLLIHLKNLPRQSWQYRPRLRLRFTASDAHKVLGVFGLPFTLALAWSGALLCLVGPLTDGLAGMAYGGDAARVAALRHRPFEARPAGPEPASMASFEALIAAARTTLPGVDGQPKRVDIIDVGHASAWARVYFPPTPFGGDVYALLDAVDARVLQTGSTPRSPSATFERILFDLHYGRYGGALLKALYALLSLGVCALIVTGNIIWLERRASAGRRGPEGPLGRLTAGVTAGLVLASAAYFLANRVLPAPSCAWLFAPWGVCVTAALLPFSVRRLGALYLEMAGSLYLGTVLLGALRAPAPRLAVVSLCDGLLLALAIGCGLVATKLRGVRRGAREVQAATAGDASTA